MLRIENVAWLALACCALTVAQTAPPPSVPVEMIITVSHLYGREPPALTRDDLIVAQPIDPLPIVSLVPLRGDRAGLELFLLVDHCSDCEADSKIDELRRFILAQPPTTAVGVAYIKNGNLRVVENLTPDHERAVKALAVPTGGTPSTPFKALTELIQKWGKSPFRRAVIVFSNGIDPTASDAAPDDSAEAAIAAAQRANVTVYAIYHPSADYITRDFEKLHSGQIQLAHVATETGGEAYFWTFGLLPSLAPYLSDLGAHLANQYLLKFLASPGQGPGELRDVTIKSKIGDVELMTPFKVWVPGRRAASAGTSSWDQ